MKGPLTNVRVFKSAAVEALPRFLNLYASDTFLVAILSKSAWMMMPISIASSRWTVLLFSLLNWIGTVLWVWIGVRPEGLNTSGARLFYWHPVLASCAMLVLFPHGFLAWRNARSANRARTKWFHATLLIAAFVLLNVAVSLAFFSHRQQNLPNFYSLHSWMGMLAIGAMKGNIIGGLLSTFSSYVRGMKLVSKLHRLSGVLACAMGFVAMLLGFAKEQEFVVQKSGQAFGASAILGGALGLASGFVGVVVISSVLAEQENKQDQEIAIAKNLDEEVPRSSERAVSDYEA